MKMDIDANNRIPNAKKKSHHTTQLTVKHNGRAPPGGGCWVLQYSARQYGSHFVSTGALFQCLAHTMGQEQLVKPLVISGKECGTGTYLYLHFKQLFPIQKNGFVGTCLYFFFFYFGIVELSLFFLFLDRVHIQSSHTTAHIYLLISSLRVGCHGRGTIINTCTMYSKSKVKRWYRLFMPRSVSIATLPGSHLQCPVFFLRTGGNAQTKTQPFMFFIFGLEFLYIIFFNTTMPDRSCRRPLAHRSRFIDPGTGQGCVQQPHYI